MQELSQIRLKYFYEVMQSGSVRAAAEKLGLSPSLISRQVHILEDEVGFALFERRKGKLEPTEIAEVISDYYRGYLSQQEYLATRLSEIRGMQRGDVKVAVSEGVAEMMVHEVLVPFYSRHPGIHVDLTTDSVNSIVEKVRTDSVHIGICFNPPEDPEVSVVRKSSQPVGIVMRIDHPLARSGDAVTLQQALQHPYAMMSPDYGLRRYINLIEFQNKVKFEVALTTNSLQVLKQFVLSGAGMALMSSPGLWDAATQEKIKLLKIEDVSLPAPEFCLLTRKNRPLPTAAGRLLEAVKSRLPVFIR